MDTEILKQIKETDWDALPASKARELITALREAVAAGEGWFAAQAAAFGSPTKKTVAPRIVAPQIVNGDGREIEVMDAIPITRPKRVRRTRAQMLAAANVNEPHPPIRVGGGETGEERPPEASIFQSSYVSKEGPRSDVYAELPADHPRRVGGRESSVTAQNDADDFNAAESALKRGAKAQDLFN